MKLGKRRCAEKGKKWALCGLFLLFPKAPALSTSTCTLVRSFGKCGMTQVTEAPNFLIPSGKKEKKNQSWENRRQREKRNQRLFISPCSVEMSWGIGRKIKEKPRAPWKVGHWEALGVGPRARKLGGRPAEPSTPAAAAGPAHSLISMENRLKSVTRSSKLNF